MESNILRLLPVLLLFFGLYKVTDYLYKKSLKEPLDTDDRERIRFREYANYKIKVGRIVFILMTIFVLLFIIYEMFAFLF